MSRIGITYQEVVEVIKKIQDQGKEPTADRIRGILGTGSNSTISRYLREWRSEGVLSGSNALPSDLIAIIKELWARMQAKAEQTILSSQQDADKIVQAEKARAIQQAKENDALKTKIHELEEVLHLKTEENKSINQALASEQIELSRLSGYAGTLEKQLEYQKLENQKLHQLLNNIQKNLEHYQSSIQKLHQEQSITMEKQKNEYMREIIQIRQQFSSEVSEKDKFKLLFEQTCLTLEKLELANKKMQTDFRKTEINEATLKDRCDRLAEQQDNLTRVLDSKSKLLMASEQKLATETKKSAELNRALKQLEDKVQTLRHEQIFLIQEKSNVEGQLRQFQELNNKKMAIS